MSQISPPKGGIVWPRRRGNTRATVRYHCAPATVGRLYIGTERAFQHAWVLNLSQSGIALFLARPIAVGIPLVIQLRGNEPGAVHDLIATVVHCTAQLTGEWLIGCEFAHPLAADVLDSLL